MARKCLLICSVSFLAVAVSGAPAHAQTAPADAASSGSVEVPPSDTGASTTEEDEIIVTGIRGAVAASIQAKRQSDVIADVLTAEDIGKFPDKNVAEALQRIPGIVMNREFGEGERVSVRGTDPSLTKTLLNGHSIATADWFILDQLDSTRSFNYLTLPAEIVGQVEVYKSPQADVEEGGIGGTINVHTRDPLDLDPFTFSASAQAVYSERADKLDPQVSGIFSWKNDAETFGVLLGGFYQRRQIRRDGIEVLGYSTPGGAAGTNEVPLLIGSAYFRQERERYGGNIGVQFRPTDALEFNITGLYSRFGANNINSNYLAWPDRVISGGGTLTNTTVIDGTIVAGTVASAPGGLAVVYDTISRDARAETMSADFDVNYTPSDDLTVHFKAGWTKASGDTTDEFFFESVSPGAFSFDLRGGAPQVRFTSPDPLAPGGMVLDFGRNPTVQSDDEEKYAYFDVERAVDWGPLNALKFGLKYTDHDRASLFASQPGFVSGLQCGGRNCTVSDFFSGGRTPSNFLKNIGGDGTLRDYWLVDEQKLRNIYLSQTPAKLERFLVGGSTFSIDEKTYGGYGMAKLGGDNWKANIGVRVIRTDQTANGNLLGAPNPQVISPFGNYTPITVERSYTSVLPSANLSFDLTNELVLRFAAGKTIARPDFVDITPGVNLNGTTLTGGGGNPNIDPFQANQYDLSIEWYPDRETIFALALYYKDIQSYIVNETNEEVFPTEIPAGSTVDPRCTPIGGTLYNCPYQVNRPVNGPGGRNQGLEVQFSRSLFGGFGVIGNYTYSDAKSGDGGPIPGNSKHTLNLTGYYENDLLSARLSYNYRSKFFINIDRNSPLNQTATESLDASINVNLTDQIALTADAVNLTNHKIEQFSGTRSRPRSIYDNGRQFYAGVRVKF
jgi:iron complex outermembrane receptor protein